MFWFEEQAEQPLRSRVALPTAHRVRFAAKASQRRRDNTRRQARKKENKHARSRGPSGCRAVGVLRLWRSQANRREGSKTEGPPARRSQRWQANAESARGGGEPSWPTIRKGEDNRGKDAHEMNVRTHTSEGRREREKSRSGMAASDQMMARISPKKSNESRRGASWCGLTVT